MSKLFLVGYRLSNHQRMQDLASKAVVKIDADVMWFDRGSQHSILLIADNQREFANAGSE